MKMNFEHISSHKWQGKIHFLMGIGDIPSVCNAFLYKLNIVFHI